MPASEVATRGRPRTFDEQAVLDELTALFWRQGYANTSITDIVDASGVHKPTLYRVFGTKDEIFATVLRRYLDAQMATVEAMIEKCAPGSQGIHEFLDGFAAMALDGGKRDGCLLVTASNELSGTMPGFDDFAGAHRSALRERLAPLMARATADPAVIEQRSELVAILLAGFQVSVRAGAADSEIQRMVDSIHAVIDTW